MLSYTNRDYEAILNDLKSQVPLLTDKWTDFNDSDIGTILLKLLAGTSSMLNFYIDKQSNENFIGLAKEDKNIESILELIGYRKPLRACSKSTQVFEIPSNSQGDSSIISNIIIPKYSLLWDESTKTQAITVESALITPTMVRLEVPVYQAELKSISLKGSDFKDFKYYLPQSNLARENFELIIDNILWEVVDNAFLEIEGGKKYSIHRDPYDAHYILLTHDYKSFINTNSDIIINYLVTEGEDINIPSRCVNRLGFTPTDVNGNIYNDTLFTYNKDAFTGGFTGNDVYLERAKLQKGYNTLDRLVSLEDYMNYVNIYPGVKDCEVSDISVTNTTNPKPYQVDVFVLMKDLNPMSDAFKHELESDLKKKQNFANKVILKDAILTPIDLKVEFTITSDTLQISSVEQRVKNILLNHFSGVAFKNILLVEDIISKVLSSVPEVHTIKVQEPLESFYPTIGECYKVDTINVIGKLYQHI